MATTTASLAISSSDLQPGNRLSVNASSLLMKTGLTEGLEILDAGTGELTVAMSHKKLNDALGTADTSNWMYLANHATDDTYYIEVVLHDTVIGRLYGGDWMFTPWNMSDAAAEWSIEAEGGTQKYEYAFFKSTYVLADSAQADADGLNP
jgi:hypothetical protein